MTASRSKLGKVYLLAGLVLAAGMGYGLREMVGFNLSQRREVLTKDLDELRASHPGCFRGEACPVDELASGILSNTKFAVGGTEQSGKHLGTRMTLPDDLIRLSSAGALVVGSPAGPNLPIDLWVVTAKGVYVLDRTSTAAVPR
jgi:hypothetical protein